MNIKNYHIGKTVKSIVKQRNTSLASLAAELGVSRQVLNNWLNKDDMPVKVLFTISQIIDYDFFNDFRLNSEESGKPKICLNIEIPDSLQDEILEYIRDKNLYNLLKK